MRTVVAFGLSAVIGAALGLTAYLLWVAPRTAVSPTAPPPSAVGETALAHEVAVAFAVSTGWPNSEAWDEVRRFDGSGDLVVITTTYVAWESAERLCRDVLTFSGSDAYDVSDFREVWVMGRDEVVLFTCNLGASDA